MTITSVKAIKTFHNLWTKPFNLKGFAGPCGIRGGLLVVLVAGKPPSNTNVLHKV